MPGANTRPDNARRFVQLLGSHLATAAVRLEKERFLRVVIRVTASGVDVHWADRRVAVRRRGAVVTFEGLTDAEFTPPAERSLRVQWSKRLAGELVKHVTSL